MSCAIAYAAYAAAARVRYISHGPLRYTSIDHRGPRSSAYAETLFKIEEPSLDDLIEAEGVLEDATSKMNRVFGSLHPHTVGAGQDLATVQGAIARKRAAPDISFDLKTPERAICKSRRPRDGNT